MIPKIIHYCWFGGGEMSVLAKKCLASWKKHLPGYLIMEWNEHNFDVNLYRYSAEAYNEGKFAFVSDVCRLHVLKNNGGIYFDTDVELLRPLAGDMLCTVAFTGFEGNNLLSSAIMGSVANAVWINDLLDDYISRSFYLQNGQFDLTPNTESITKIMKEKKGLLINNSFQDLVGYCVVYPSDYFSPKSWKTLKVNITKNTYTVHHFAASWVSDGKFSVIGRFSNRLLGKRLSDFLAKIYRNIRG